jgi:hypothetical protein
LAPIEGEQVRTAAIDATGYRARGGFSLDVLALPTNVMAIKTGRSRSDSEPTLLADDQFIHHPRKPGRHSASQDRS